MPKKEEMSFKMSVENKLKENEKIMCRESNRGQYILNALEELKIEYNSLHDYFTQGNIIRPRVNWYEKGEKIMNTF